MGAVTGVNPVTSVGFGYAAPPAGTRHLFTQLRCARWLCLELEGGADVNGLAVAPLVLQHAVTLDIVPHATGHRDAPRERV